MCAFICQVGCRRHRTITGENMSIKISIDIEPIKHELPEIEHELIRAQRCQTPLRPKRAPDFANSEIAKWYV